MRFQRLFLLLFFGLLLGSSWSYAQIFKWKNPNLKNDTLVNRDSILAKKLTGEFFTRDTLNYVHLRKPLVYTEDLLAKTYQNQALGDLNAKGSIIRGITFGNNQGSSVQSTMDLQIAGRLSDDVTLLASISDHNLPIQADGYTQTLQEFDKIYLQLNIKNHTILRAGHVDLDDQTSYFSKYQRRTMGLQAETFWEKNGTRTDAMFSMGVARSEFQRMRFQGIEGNQGPYRLTGKNGELFITIISGSEQVYLDGILMKRGEKQDYVINYNTGELTFTSFRPIYKQNFITISYNYTNRNYSRYLVAGSVKHQRERFKIRLDAFVETDAKNSSLSQNLSKEDIESLKQAGNDPSKMFGPAGEIAEYDVNKVLYRRVDNGSSFYYEHSTDAEEVLYQVAFTYFGEGLGDYRLQQSTNNGRIFEFAGEGLGDYRAAKRLVPPVSTQVYTMASEYELKEGRVGADFSLSNHNSNLFSGLDRRENTGYAARFYGEKSFRHGEWSLTPMFEYQHIDRRFTILDRINSVDFWRDFNLEDEFSGRTQNRFIGTLNSTWRNAFLKYVFNYLSEQDFYKGVKNDFDFGWKNQRWLASAHFSYLDTKGTDLNTRMIRGAASAELLGTKGSWSVGGSLEHNEKKVNLLDQMDTGSYRWNEIFLQKKIGDSLRTRLDVRIYYRTNDSVRVRELVKVNDILGFQAESELIKTANTQLSVQGHFRRFFYQNRGQSTQTKEDFLMGNVTFNRHFFNQGLRFQAFYELGSGQEAQREFQYIKVTDGQGIYKWTDYNEDGIQQLDEFEVAEYVDLAQYIRVYTNTINYLPSNKNKLKASLFLNPSVVFNSGNKFLRRWNFNLSILSENSYFKQSKMVVWNPFHQEENQILKVQNVLFSAQFNPVGNTGWSGNYKFSDNQNLINANFSVENNERKSHVFNLGYSFTPDFRADWENKFLRIFNSSQLFDSRDYLLNQTETRPKLTYNFTQAILGSIEAAYKDINRTDGDERLKASEVTGTFQWERPKTSVRANFSFINNNFTGNSFSIVGNQMLEGLKAGKNQVWSLILQQRINSFLNVSVNYEGRTSGERTIHIGSVEARASF